MCQCFVNFETGNNLCFCALLRRHGPGYRMKINLARTHGAVRSGIRVQCIVSLVWVTWPCLF